MSDWTSSGRDNILKSHPGIFFYVCVFFNYLKKISYKRIFAAAALPFALVANTPYGKRHVSRIEPVLLQAWTYYIKAYIHPNLLHRCPISSMHSSTQKTPQKSTLKLSLRHLLVNLKNIPVVAPPTSISIELWRQWQQLLFPPSQVSDGNLRSVRHDRRTAVIRVRGCRITKVQE